MLWGHFLCMFSMDHTGKGMQPCEDNTKNMPRLQWDQCKTTWIMGLPCTMGLSYLTGTLNTPALTNLFTLPFQISLAVTYSQALDVNMPCPLSQVLAGSSAHSKDLRMICELQYRYSTLSLRSLPSTSSTSVLSIVFKGMKALLQACSQKKPITRAIIVPLAYAVEEGGGSSE